MRKSQWLQVLGGVAMVALAVSACGGGTQEEPTATGDPTAGHSESTEAAVDQETLLDLQDQLATQLGDSFVQGWIEAGKLHVATTDPQDTTVIEQAGAVAHLVAFSAAQLREGIMAIMQWQAAQADPIRTAIHGYELDGSVGGLRLRVDPGHAAQVQQLLEADKPAGQIPLELVPSSGIASPAG